MAQVDCGIDIGSTNLKVVFIDDGAQVLKTLDVPTPRIQDAFGSVTDVMALIDILEHLIVRGWQELRLAAPLRSITTAGIGEDGVGVSADLRPLGAAIPWFDRRASDEAETLLREHVPFTRRTGLAMNPTLSAAKWLWLRRNRPQELASAVHWITVTDFPAVWWTGKPFMSLSLAPRTGCFDVAQRNWIDSLLSLADAPPLPQLLAAGHVVGGVHGGLLRDSGAASGETLVAAGGHDHPVAASAIRRFDPLARVDSLGTANLIYGETAAREPPLPTDTLAYSVPPDGSAGIACLGVIELSLLFSSHSLTPQIVRQVLKAERQNRTSSTPPSTSTTELFARNTVMSACESACQQARQILAELDAASVPPGPVYATGGWSRSQAFMTMRANIFATPIHVVDDMELTAVGAALFGAAAATGQSVCPFSRADIRIIEPA